MKIKPSIPEKFPALTTPGERLALAVPRKFVCNAGMAESKQQYDIQVVVETEYLPEQSDVAENRFVFSYHITLRNIGTVPAQLISRHWIITDADGDVQEVKGLGVVGHQPLLAPGQQFSYTSGCALTTAVGTMRGSYQMTAEDGTQFEAAIPEFVLSMPRVLH